MPVNVNDNDFPVPGSSQGDSQEIRRILVDDIEGVELQERARWMDICMMYLYGSYNHRDRELGVVCPVQLSFLCSMDTRIHARTH